MSTRKSKRDVVPADGAYSILDGQKAPQGEGAKASPAAWDTMKTSLAVPVCQMPAFQRKEGS